MKQTALTAASGSRTTFFWVPSIICEKSHHYFYFPSFTGQVVHSFLQSSIALKTAAASPCWGRGQPAGEGTGECWFQFFQTEGGNELVSHLFQGNVSTGKA